MSTNNSYKFQQDKKPAVKSSILSSSAPIFVPSASKPSFLTRQVIIFNKFINATFNQVLLFISVPVRTSNDKMFGLHHF